MRKNAHFSVIQALDLSMRDSDEIKATESGEVLHAGDGHVVIKLDNDFGITFAHLWNINVKKGDRLEPGQAIGSFKPRGIE